MNENFDKGLYKQLLTASLVNQPVSDDILNAPFYSARKASVYFFLFELQILESTKALLRKYRVENKIGYDFHITALAEIGWSADEYEV